MMGRQRHLVAAVRRLGIVQVEHAPTVWEEGGVVERGSQMAEERRRSKASSTAAAWKVAWDPS
jgi:hypothetical protein